MRRRRAIQIVLATLLAGLFLVVGVRLSLPIVVLHYENEQLRKTLQDIDSLRRRCNEGV